MKNLKHLRCEEKMPRSNKAKRALKANLKKATEVKNEIRRKNILAHGYATKFQAEAAGVYWLGLNDEVLSSIGWTAES